MGFAVGVTGEDAKPVERVHDFSQKIDSDPKRFIEDRDHQTHQPPTAAGGWGKDWFGSQVAIQIDHCSTAHG